MLLIGQEAAGVQVLRALAAASHDVVAVLSQDPVSKGGPASLRKTAVDLQIDLLEARRVTDPAFAATVREWDVDILLNAHSLHLIADEVLAAPRLGSFNLHPGPLPEYSGLNTVGWAIYNGEVEYGVTVHWMVPRIDAGAIAYLDRFPIDDGATALTLSAECTRRGIELLLRVLSSGSADPPAIPAEAQDLSRRRYFARASVPQQGRIDWAVPADQVVRFGRAFDYGPYPSPWGRPFAHFGAARIEVTGLSRTGSPSNAPPGTVRLSEGGELEVASLDEWVRLRRVYFGGVLTDASRLIHEVLHHSPSAQKALK